MSKNIDECSRIYEASGAYTARVDDDGRAVCTSCGNLIADHRVTDMVATDSKPSTGHSEPPQEDPTTKLEDKARAILDRYFEARITEPEEKHLYTRLATQAINELIISEREAFVKDLKQALWDNAFESDGVRKRVFEVIDDQLSKSKRSE